MNYRHAYHAGSLHDLFKHAVWLHLIARMQQKPAPVLLVDSFAGAGLYNLEGTEASATGEAVIGIKKLMQMSDIAPSLQPLAAAVRRVNSSGLVKFYPGSTLLALGNKRTDDHLVACELHPDEASKLKERVKAEQRVNHQQNITVRAEDGLIALKSLLPTPLRRALVLLDPPYEKTDEYDRLARNLAQAYGRFPTGVFVLWYPLKDSVTTSRSAFARFWGELQTQGVRHIIAAEFSPEAKDAEGRLNGSGMMIINPPWQVEAEIMTIARNLAEALGLNGARYGIKPLVGE
ncbi:MAG: 23S rRNA (adenine(2030)-N(6))-methyltransferase RlmJ [Candidatus Pacebacteria bacterium]|nr:23S rRNA (adenine(2030)-N(6))-methyltransferase RlmJ [Candidatus Paceibacterota bacterium]